MPNTDPIIIPIEGQPEDFLKDAKAVNGALDKMQANVKQTGSTSAAAAKTASMSWTDFRSAYMVVLDAVRVGQQIWAQTGAVFVEYAENVKNMSRNIGASAEETSRLIQVADDVRVSYGTLTTAMKFAQKDGIEVSVDSLARLSDQYNALTSPIEKQTFLIDKFGRGGLEMGKLMEQGGNKIRSMNAAIDDSLVLTDEAIKKSDEYQRALDDLGDKWEGLKIKMGENSIEPVTNALENLTSTTTIWMSNVEQAGIFWDNFSSKNETAAKWITAFTDKLLDMNPVIWGLRTIFKDNSKATDEATNSQEEFNQAQEDGAGASQAQADAVKIATDALANYKDMLSETSARNKEALDLSLQMAQDQRKYEEDHAAKAQELQKATADGNIEAMQEAQKGIQELEAQWHESTERMIFDMVQTKVAADGLTNSEFSALQDLAVQKGIMTQADADRAKSAMDEAQAIADGISLQEDVMSENMAINERMKELEGEKAAAAAGTTTEVNNTNAAMIQVVGSTQAAAQAMANLQAQAGAAAGAAAAIRIPSMPSVNMNTATAPSLMSAGGSAGGYKPFYGVSSRDSGGMGVAGQPYMIGTGAQPEMFIPSTNGKFVPNADGGGKTIIVNITNPQPKAAEQSVRDQLKNLSYLGTIN